HLRSEITDGLDIDIGEDVAFGIERIPAEVRRQIGDAFEVGDHLEGGGDESQVARDGLLEREEVDAVAFEVEIHSIDLVVAFDHTASETTVLRSERVETHPEAFENHLTHIQNVLAKGVELA